MTTATKPALTTTFTDRSDPDYRERIIIEIVGIARRIQEWQGRQVPALANEGLIKRFPRLGSSRTYRRILNEDFSTLDPDAQLANYRIVWNKIKTISGVATEEIYEDLNSAVEIQLAIAGVVQQHGKERLVTIEGPTGSGKTEGLRLAARAFPGSVGMVEANECWSSPREALGDMLIACGAVTRDDDIPKTTGKCLRRLINHLNQFRMALAIDEGHHMCAKVLNILKTILNKTDSVVVIAAIDTIWTKLAARHWQEAQQLTHNRGFACIRLGAPTTGDTVKFLSRRVTGWQNDDWQQHAAGKVAALSRTCGNLSFLRRIATELGKEPGPLTPTDLTEAANLISLSLKRRK